MHAETIQRRCGLDGSGLRHRVVGNVKETDELVDERSERDD